VGHEPALGRFVVVRRHHEDGVGAGATGGARPLDRDGGRVAPDAGDHAGAPARHLDRERDEPLVLPRIERRSLPGRAARHEQPHASPDLPLEQGAEPRLVHLARRSEGRHERGSAAVQPFHAQRHTAFLSISSMSSKTSANAYMPRRPPPDSQRAASSAPAAKVSRLRAVWVSRI